MAVFKCDSCGYERVVPDVLVGKKAKCPDCIKSVVIVEDPTPSSTPFEEAFEGLDEELAETEEERLAAQGEQGAESIDIDRTESDVDYSSEDVLCEKCGAVVPHDKAGTHCPECGVLFPNAIQTSHVDERDVDVSDLTGDEPAPQVWDTDFAADDSANSGALVEELAPRRGSIFTGSLPLNIFSGLVSGVVAFYFAVAMAMLASTQIGVSEYMPHMLTVTVVGMSVGCIFYSLQGRVPFALAGPGTVVTAMMFFFLGSVYRDLAGTTHTEGVLATILVTIALTSVIAGLGLWIIGKLKAAELVRHIPVQIVGGVIGGVGVFVVLASISWMGRFDFDWRILFFSFGEFVEDLQQGGGISAMAPSLGLGLALFLGLANSKNSLFLLFVLLVTSALGYGAGAWYSNDLVTSLAHPVPDFVDAGITLSWDAIRAGYENIQWSVLKSNALYIGALGALIALTSMYRITRLELVQGADVDLNVEYRALGLTNIASGLVGGMPLGISFGRSVGNYRCGARGAVSGVIAGLVCFAGLYYAELIIPLIPRFIPEALLLFAGLTLIRGWMFKSRTPFTRREDVWMLWITFLVTAIFGILLGVGFCVSLALAVTVRRNSLLGPVSNILSGATHRSNVDRAPAQDRVLVEYGDHIHIMRLQGFISLGSMTTLLRDIHRRLADKQLLPVEYIILDFRNVSGLASAGGVVFDKLSQLVEEYEVHLVIASAPLELQEHMESGGYLHEAGGNFRLFLDLDYAMEWCENRLLESENILELKEMKLPEMLAPVFPEPSYIPALMKVFKRVVVQKEEAVFLQGEASDAMYFVESGRLEIMLETENSKRIRLKKVGPGAVFGEMGIYNLAARSATVRASEKCVLYMINNEKLKAVEKRAPMLVSCLHRYIINTLANRLANASFKVRDLMH
ncbi:Cyclic nucleotide-binding protein [Pseudodesulfovibrio profundus]|uniref:Cyclic nucleotide-binding protein n=1 Tax=Pseudodesulfovibrio profundus TaxID=57320 RepID=A0A2C8F4U7_9BACT|nr:Cyclic nucleotide-binding protein [Pseudodesulfovibrio profundus]